jgi:hypothetical protein
LFLYSYEADFIQGLLKINEKKLARSFNFTFRYTDDVLSLNNSRFGEFVYRIYPIEIEIKDTTDTDRFASYLDLHLEIDSEGRLRTILYDKRDNFNSYTYIWSIDKNVILPNVNLCLFFLLAYICKCITSNG